MIKKAVVFIISVSILLSICLANQQYKPSVRVNTVNGYDIEMKRDLLCLMMAYREFVKGIQVMPDDRVYLVMNSGNRILYDDKKTKTPDEKLNHPDLQDMMEQVYPLNGANYLRPEDYNPGRFRVYALFEEVYGATKEEIEKNLVSVQFGYEGLPFNKNNGASEALKRVNHELVLLTQACPDIIPFISPSSGTFNYETIVGTDRLSAHAFGIAIDLAADGKDYWQWASRKDGEKRMAVYPPEVVRVFESNNFIWGGRWGHFDIMHYEYRPELVLKARFFPVKPLPGQNWYYGSPYAENINVRYYVAIIDQALK